MSDDAKQLPTKYYVDFENVHGPGLKGIEDLGEDDVVYIFFSQAAETFHIEHAIGIMNSKARVEFVEIDGGTRNALDFQLVAALFGRIEEGFQYAIVSGDVGFDAAIKMGERLELPAITRITDLTGSIEPVPTKTARRRKSAQKQTKTADANDAAETEMPTTLSGQSEAKEEQAASASKKTAALKKKQPAPSQPTSDEANKPQPKNQIEDAKKKEVSNGTERGGRYSKRKEVKAMLAERGISLKQQQLSTVMKSLNETKSKQQFYRNIIKEEGQEQGLELYRKVRDYYDAMYKVLQT